MVCNLFHQGNRAVVVVVLVELVVVVLVVVDLRSRDLGLSRSRSRDLEVVLVVVEGIVVVVDFVVFVLDFVVLRVVLEDFSRVEEVVVVGEVVLFLFKDLRRSLQLGFSVVVGTKFHHFLNIWVVMVVENVIMEK